MTDSNRTHVQKWEVNGSSWKMLAIEEHVFGVFPAGEECELKARTIRYFGEVWSPDRLSYPVQAHLCLKLSSQCNNQIHVYRSLHPCGVPLTSGDLHTGRERGSPTGSYCRAGACICSDRAWSKWRVLLMDNFSLQRFKEVWDLGLRFRSLKLKHRYDEGNPGPTEVTRGFVIDSMVPGFHSLLVIFHWFWAVPEQPGSLSR